MNVTGLDAYVRYSEFFRIANSSVVQGAKSMLLLEASDCPNDHLVETCKIEEVMKLEIDEDSTIEAAIEKYFEPLFETSTCETCFIKNRKDKEQEMTKMKCVAVFPEVLVIEIKVFDDEGDIVQDEFLVPEQLDLTQYLKESE